LFLTKLAFAGDLSSVLYFSSINPESESDASILKGPDFKVTMMLQLP